MYNWLLLVVARDIDRFHNWAVETRGAKFHRDLAGGPRGDLATPLAGGSAPAGRLNCGERQRGTAYISEVERVDQFLAGADPAEILHWALKHDFRGRVGATVWRGGGRLCPYHGSAQSQECKNFHHTYLQTRLQFPRPGAARNNFYSVSVSPTSLNSNGLTNSRLTSGQRVFQSKLVCEFGQVCAGSGQTGKQALSAEPHPFLGVFARLQPGGKPKKRCPLLLPLGVV
jgi:hypothetical protein